ncbi:hypothetical protein [Liberiplasma polymorphum]|uniref:hypothetical protein n=1 Tax=Liberiplasma polymorphum TaxID=3374570 RepID=UPI003774900A
MKKLNHYQKDIAFLVLLIVLQLAFSSFYPFRNPETATAIEVSRSFLLMRFHFVDLNITQIYFPTLTVIYSLLLIYLVLQKSKQFALIYGFAVVLVAKVYYVTELFALEGIYTNLETTGFLSKQVMHEGQIVAQDITLYLLFFLLVIKILIYVHDFYMFKKSEVKPTIQSEN